MSFANDRAEEQMARAKRIAIELAGNRASRQLVMSMLALVKSVEGDGAFEPEPKKPVGSRKVLNEKPKYERVSKPAVKPVEKPVQEELW